MGRDSGYGSGKPRSAANSANRRDKAASAGLRKQAQQRQAAKPFAKAVAKAVADGSYGKIQELGVGGGVRSISRLLTPASKLIEQSASRIASGATARFKANQAQSSYYQGEAFRQSRELSSMRVRTSEATRAQIQRTRGLESSYLSSARSAADAANRIQQSGRMNKVRNEFDISAKLRAVRGAKRENR